MSNRVEWALASVPPTLLSPDHIQDLSPDGNSPRDWGLTLGSDGAMVLYGQPDELRQWLRQAAELVGPGRRNTDDG